MVNRNLIRTLESDQDFASDIDAAMATMEEDFDPSAGADFAIAVNNIVDGHVIRVDNEFILVDIGYKSEGSIHLNEWEEGDEQRFFFFYRPRPQDPTTITGKGSFSHRGKPDVKPSRRQFTMRYSES